jgi:hypothetical protein
MGSTSYGMSCNGNQFVTKKFRGGVGQDEVEITDNLDPFNAAIEQVECVQVYSSSNNNNNNSNKQQTTTTTKITTRLQRNSCPLARHAVSANSLTMSGPVRQKLISTLVRSVRCTGAKCLLTLPETRLMGYFFIVMLVSGLECSGRHTLQVARKGAKAWISFANPLTYPDFPALCVVTSLSSLPHRSRQVSAKVVDAIQKLCEAEAPVNQSVRPTFSRAGRTVQMQMLSSTHDG